MAKERYENLGGVRAYACIGIVLMHVLANGNFGLSGFVFARLIPSFTNFTLLFMLLSAFSMCCGYYEQFQNGTISLEQFYLRRYQRIWPFFALLCTAELILDHNLNALYEWFADLTLAFGLIPNHGIEVVGVGWFLGTVFVFYMIFPFFVFLMKDKKRAWFVMAVCIILHILCVVRFEVANDRGNIIYSFVFFIAGGLIYLYRDQLKKLNRIWKAVIGTATVALLAVYYLLSGGPLSIIILLLLFTLLTIVGISSGGGISKILLQNKVAHFLGGISMEIYLCHMFVYRVCEKLDLIHMTGNEVVNYCFISIATIAGAVAVAFCWNKLQKMIKESRDLCHGMQKSSA